MSMQQIKMAGVSKAPCCRLSCFSLLLLLALLAGLARATEEGGQNGGEAGSGELGAREEGTEDDRCTEEEEVLDSSIKVARLEFGEVETEFLVASFIMLVVLAKLFWHHKLMHPVSSNIPESCMLIVVGAHIGGIILGTFFLDDCNEGKDPPYRFSPNLFFLYLLPPIVLESGYFLDNRGFFENLITICVYAVIGTVWNAFALGFTLYGLFQGGVVLSGLNVNFTIASALLFGTICSAVDPVAVLAVFDEIHVNKLLHILVFGESLLNDAVTIVLFQVLGAFANKPFAPIVTNGTDSGDIDGVEVVLGVVQFFVVVGASVIIGILFGMITAFITRFSEHVHVLEPIIILAMGYLSYITADIFEFSGIVSLIFCAIVMKHYVEANISRKSHTTIKYSLKVLSNVSEMVIFLFLGVSLYDVSVHHLDWPLIFWTIFFALIYRPIGVIVLTCILNIFRVRKIDMKSIFVMSYSGLRGAVAFSLALTRIFEEPILMESDDPALRSELVLRQSMFTAVTFLVLFTIFVQGTTIKPLVKKIKVKTASEHKPTMNETIHNTTIDHVMSGVEDVLGHFGHNRLREWVQRIDAAFFRRIFERYPEAKDEQILHTFKRLQHKESDEAAEKNLVFEYHRSQDTDREAREGTHISLHEESEYEESGEHRQSLTPEECIPALNDVLSASFAHPHEDLRGHTLGRSDREYHEDHRFEPVKTFRSLLQHKRKAKHARRKRQQRMAERLGLRKSPLPSVVEGEQEVEGAAVISMITVSSQVPLTPQTSSKETEV